ncbi:MAG: S46 family peptidase [Saprospiraceae bacterium]
MPALGVDLIANKLDPELINIREVALGIMDKYMRKDEATKLKLASKFAGIANYWKKWIEKTRVSIILMLLRRKWNMRNYSVRN